LQAAGRVQAAIDRHDGVLSGDLVDLGVTARALGHRPGRVDERGDAVFVFLSTHDPEVIARTAADHVRQARSVRDPAAAASLEAAADARRRQLQTWEQLRVLFERIGAELVSVEAGLDELHARVVKLTFDDPSTADVPSIGQDLATLHDRVRLLERSAEATLRDLA
ncbi:MAG: hypothetical protein ABMB14_39390, partial [Myxococcota bacterium]